MEASANWSAAESPLIKKKRGLENSRQARSGREGVNYIAGSSSIGGNRRWEPRDGCTWLVLTHCGCNNGQGLLVVVPRLLEHMSLHLWYTTREGQLDQAVDALAETERQKPVTSSGPLFILISTLWKWIVDEMSRVFSCGVVMNMPAACQVGLWLSLVQRERNPQGLFTKHGEVGWRLHG